MAQPQGMGSMIGNLLGANGQIDPEKMKMLFQLQQLLQPQGQQMGPTAQLQMQQMGQPVQTQASQGYLSSGAIKGRRA